MLQLPHSFTQFCPRVFFTNPHSQGQQLNSQCEGLAQLFTKIGLVQWSPSIADTMGLLLHVQMIEVSTFWRHLLYFW